jgi:peptidyl-tRNA hydrolase
MRNIVKELGSDKFARIRVGFKPLEESRIPLIDYVLSGIKGDDVLLFDKMTQVAGEAGLEFAKGTPIQQVMQKYNVNK